MSCTSSLVFWSVLREENDGFRMVGECYVQNVMDGEEMDGLDASRMENIVIQ
jgi:hypothetical protein